jgi:hypothetical protein
MSNKPNKHAQTKKKLRIVGLCLLIFGGAFFIVGLMDFIDAFQSMRAPTFFVFSVLGLPIAGVGAGLTVFSFQREIHRYVSNETAPVVNETAEQVAPAVETLARAVKKGLDEEVIVCECGAKNDFDSKFCKNCGKKF